MARETQTEEYWRDDFTITPADENTLQEYFLQQGSPLSTQEIATYLMERQLSAGKRARRASKSTYAPTETFEVGAELTFPLLDGQVGEVVGTRAGRNPRYGEWNVIQVRFDDSYPTREFAVGLQEGILQSAGTAEPWLEPDEIVARFSPYVRETVEETLGKSSNFVRLGAAWLPRLMLVDFHEGHRNIAEAMIDITGEPMSPAELLTEIPLDEDGSDDLKQFSLNYALTRDERFSNVGTDAEPRWFLPRLG
jgi:hypothetical protein